MSLTSLTPCGVLALMLASCADHHQADAGRDAGHDAGSDAALDAGRDAGRDAGARDAGRDAGTDAGPRDGGPDDPGWVRLPGLPDDCAIERAEHPERLWNVTWSPCTTSEGDRVEGCLTTTRSSGIIGAWRDGEQVWLDLIGGDALGEGRIVGLGPVDGPPLAAWREPRQSLDDDGLLCVVTAHGVGGGRAAIVVGFNDFNDNSRSRAWLYVAGPETIGATTEPTYEFPSGFVPRDRQITELWISAELLALQASPDGTLYTYRDGEWATLTGRGTVEGLPQNPVLIGDHLLWEAWRGLDDVRLVQARWGEPAAVWRDVSPSDTKGSGTDGVDVAWFDCHDRREDGSYGRTELWTAPYRRDLEAAEPRLVAVVDERSNSPAVGGGWLAARRLDPQRVEVFSLRDGALRTLIAPGGYVTEEPYYASEREIMFRGAGLEAVRFDPSRLPIEP